MGRNILLILLLPFYAVLSAQSNYDVTGTVISEEGQPLAFASVALFDLDGKLITGNETSDAGDFVLKVQEGVYILEASYVGYETHISQALDIAADRQLGEITLYTTGEILEEVEVSAARSAMSLQLDKKVFDISQNPINAGSDAANILSDLPSVDINLDGNLTLRGSTNVQILIDGKPSTLISDGTLEELAILQGDQIDRIEVITSPSARYEAEGNVGIINIITKNQASEGISGAARIFGGFPDEYGAGANIIFNHGKWILRGNYSFTHRISEGSGYSIQQSSLADTSFGFIRDREHQRGGDHYNMGGAVTYKINQHQEISLDGSYNIDDGNNSTEIFYRDLDDQGEPVNKIFRYNDEDEDETDIGINLTYTNHLSGDEGHLLTLLASYQINDEREYSEITEEEEGVGFIDMERSESLEDQRDLLFQGDYSLPLPQDLTFEAGGRVELREFQNEFIVEYLSEPTGNWEILDGQRGDYDYTEDIYAAYLMGSKVWNSFSLQTGLRFENTHTTLFSGSEKVVDRDKTYFFPSVNMTYNLNEENSWQLGYSRRISRPRFFYLLPFLGYEDSRFRFSGNPELKPELTDAFELTYLKYVDFGTLFTTLFYRHSRDVIERITIADPSGRILRFPVNLDFQNSVGIEVAMNWDLFRKLTISNQFDLYYYDLKGNYEGNHFESSDVTWRINGNMRYILAQNLNVQLSGRVRGPHEEAQEYREAVWSLDFGASYNFWNDHATVSLSIRDIFNTREWAHTIESPQLVSENRFQWRERSGTLTFLYRINRRYNQREESIREGGDGGGAEF